MTERQWQEVYTIVRKYQFALHATTNNQEEYDKLKDILDNLYPLAYPSKWTSHYTKSIIFSLHLKQCLIMISLEHEKQSPQV
jgi:hypothetical protein